MISKIVLNERIRNLSSFESSRISDVLRLFFAASPLSVGLLPFQQPQYPFKQNDEHQSSQLDKDRNPDPPMRVR